MVYWVYELYTKERYPLQPPSESGAGWFYMEILLSALLYQMANTLMTICNANEKPATVAVIGYCGIGYSLMLDKLIWHTWFLPV